MATEKLNANGNGWFEYTNLICDRNGLRGQKVHREITGRGEKPAKTPKFTPPKGRETPTSFPGNLDPRETNRRPMKLMPSLYI